MNPDTLQTVSDSLESMVVDTVTTAAGTASDTLYGWEAIQQGNGIALMMVGMTIVFCALIVLVFMMILLKWVQGHLHIRWMVRDLKKSGQEAESLEIDSEGIPGVVVAAIAMTVVLEMEQIHDEESLVLTLRSIPKPYNNWWQSTINKGWPADLSKGRPAVMQVADPERGEHV